METDAFLLPTKAFNLAKTGLSDVMTEAVRNHHPMVIDRNRGKEHAVVMGKAEMFELLRNFHFTTQTIHENGEWTLIVPELDLVAGGSSFEEALGDLTTLATEYAAIYLERLDFYRQTKRRAHFAWVMRVAMTEAERRHELFVEPPADRIPATEGRHVLAG